MRLIGLSGRLGRGLIDNAIGTFEAVATKLELGIKHCESEIDAHTVDISKSQQSIRDLTGHMDRGHRVLAKVKEIIGED